jgi:hypothetical protein
MRGVDAWGGGFVLFRDKREIISWVAEMVGYRTLI